MGKDESAFISNLWGTDLPAYRAHGHVDQKIVLNLKGVRNGPSDLAGHLKPYLENIPADKPLVMIVCKAGKTGFAQDLAKELQRAVIAFDEEVFTSPSSKQLLRPLEHRGAEGTRNWLGNRIKFRSKTGDGSAVTFPSVPRLFVPENYTGRVDGLWHSVLTR